MKRGFLHCALGNIPRMLGFGSCSFMGRVLGMVVAGGATGRENCHKIVTG